MNKKQTVPDLVWFEEADEKGNTTFVAIAETKEQLKYRIKKVLRYNTALWEECHDRELMIDNLPRRVVSFPDLRDLITREHRDWIEHELKADSEQNVFSTSLDKAINDLIKKKNMACEELTTNQLAEVIRQALCCGDLIKQVRVTDNAQNVIYIPFAESEKLHSRIKDLEDLLKENNIKEPEPIRE